jgi:hypothetical protein
LPNFYLLSGRGAGWWGGEKIARFGEIEVRKITKDEAKEQIKERRAQF